jgi:hypothetical protein
MALDQYRLGEGPRFRLPAWRDAMDQALMACLDPMLCPEGFNDEDEDAAFAA